MVSRGPGSAKTAQVRLRKDGLVNDVSVDRQKSLLRVCLAVIGKVPAAPTMPCGAGSSKSDRYKGFPYFNHFLNLGFHQLLSAVTIFSNKVEKSF